MDDIFREEGEDAARAYRDSARPYRPKPEISSNGYDGSLEAPPDLEVPPDTGTALGELTLDNFYSYLPAAKYIYRPTRELWPCKSVNAKVDPVPMIDKHGDPVCDDKGNQKCVSASKWIDGNRSVEQMTWSPGHPELITDRYLADGGWIEHEGAATYNLYRPPTLIRGDKDKAGPWIDHIRRVYPDDAEHIIMWQAHRVQHPEVKINHALVLGGAQGIGKDTILTPLKHAVGPWNFSEVSPQQILGRFTGFIKSVVLRVSEARDLGDADRFKFYDRMKSFAAEPPEGLSVDEKNLREHWVLNCTSVIVTTNYKLDGIYLPTDDRRHYVAWSDLTKDEFAPDYWNKLHRWYADGGIGHVAAYLATLDLSSFDPKAPPKKTPAFWAIVGANHAPEDSELADILDDLGNPDAVTLLMIADHPRTDATFGQWLRDRKNRRTINYRFENCGYVAVRKEAAKDGMWRLNERRQVIYAKAALSVRDRYLAAQQLTRERQPDQERDPW
jgi:hypothetical protein